METESKPKHPPAQLGWLAYVAAIAAFLVLIGLGTWQVQRLQWKEGLIATMTARLAAEPVDLDTVLRTGKPMAEEEYRRVRLSGIFDHSAERHFFATFHGDAGFYIYTPLKLDSGDFVFVNRGFVPYDRKDPSTRAEGQVGGRVEIIGLVRAGLVEKPSWAVPDNDPAKNIFYWKDIRAMRETSGLSADAPVLGLFVDADATANPGGLPEGGVTMIDLPNSHLQYAITWYGLAGALVVVFGLFAWRRRQEAS